MRLEVRSVQPSGPEHPDSDSGYTVKSLMKLSVLTLEREAVVAALSIMSSHSLMTVSYAIRGIVIGSRLDSEVVANVCWGLVGFPDPSPTSACCYAA
ncbi:hypothetical protein Tco_0818972, partial [Tanacetum coccineum]